MHEKVILQSHPLGRIDCEKPAHIYKNPDFSNSDSMETRIMLVLCNRLLITTSCHT